MDGKLREAGRAETGTPEIAGAESLNSVLTRLRVEFAAPVLVYDPRRGAALLREGAALEVFPRPGPGVIAAACNQHRAVVVRTQEVNGSSWLFLPIRWETDVLIAVLGFAPMSASGSSTVAWGPPCPEPALRAWGQAFADQHAADQHSRNEVVNSLSTSVMVHTSGPATQATERSGKAPSRRVTQAHQPGERMFTARLIRRLRISDHPERFQQLATNALRAALNVQAVAWVPTPSTESVVISGEVGRLHGEGFRTLLPCTAPKEGSRIENAPCDSMDTAVRRTCAVSADTQGAIGWLLAVNTLDDREFTQADTELLQPAASLIAAQQTNARVYADLKDLLFGVIRALTSAIDAKDPYTSGHSERVARIAVRLAEQLGMSTNQRGDLYLMGLLHDVGKIGVDDAVLKKAGPLTPDEYRQIQTHVEIGVSILKDLRKLNHLLPGIRHHHESLDGSGYPCGLAGEAIPLEARILAVADSFDAMSSTRPYRRKLTPKQIDEIFQKGSGSQWDPKIVDALFSCRLDIDMIRQKGLGESLQLAVSETLGRK